MSSSFSSWMWMTELKTSEKCGR
uniref:Uncharacterized protein n=1 Tax=Arundo donax TaxID=35708 RepID=A0A0A9A9A0_ARUDO